LISAFQFYLPQFKEDLMKEEWDIGNHEYLIQTVSIFVVTCIGGGILAGIILIVFDLKLS